MSLKARPQFLILEKSDGSSAVRSGAVNAATDAELLDRLLHGDVAALDAAISRHWSSLVAYVASVLGSRDAAEDVAQEAFCRLWERSEQLRADGSLRGFLFQAAHNLAISEQRRSRARGRALDVVRAETPRFTPPVDVGGDALDASLERAIGDLTDRRREILLLRSVHGLSYKEIAHALGIAPQTVANQFSTALSHLRRKLSHLLP
jgi:RNA polymerase sigma-70 factor, ECF subfamily